jgi:hypothetical protein
MDLKNLLGGKPAKAPKKRGPKPGQKHPGQFKKGHDPRRNMYGRPKLGLTLSDMVRDALAEALDGDYKKRDALIDIAIERAQNGEYHYLSWLFDRGYGKTPEIIELHQDDGDEVDFSKWDADDLKKYEQLLKKYHADRG